MKINIFLFEHLSSQDFLDPYFSDTRMWVQGPFKVGVSIISLMFMWVPDP